MFCECCGTKIAEGASFCHKCGARVVYKDAANHPAEVPQTVSDDKNINTMLQDDTESFRRFVDNYVRANTEFSSAEDLITNSKPWRFAWICVGILSVIGLVLGINSGLIVGGVLVFGGFFGYVTVFIVSCIIRNKYRHNFHGDFKQEINIDDLLMFLEGHLKMISPYFHGCGYLSERGGLLTTIGNMASKALNEVELCCECGPRRRSLATICIRPDLREPNSGKMQYFVGAMPKGLLIDGRAAGFLGHACLIRTAPILHATMVYYLNSRSKTNEKYN